MKTAIILNFHTGKVHFIPMGENQLISDEDLDDFNEILEKEGLSLTNCEYMVVEGNDYIRIGVTQ